MNNANRYRSIIKFWRNKSELGNSFVLEDIVDAAINILLQM
jgi:hypothetical protein